MKVKYGILLLVLCISILLCACTPKADLPSINNEYFVALNGNDANPGTAEAPFKTINHAAQIAVAGDIVTVREGIYREWVKPARGGTSEENRITYRAFPGEDVRILGSEPAKGWVQEENGLWKLSLPNDFFGDFNPFATLSRHPIYVKADESGSGWGWLIYGRWTHLGDVFIENEGLTEKQHLEEVLTTPFTWFVESDTSTTQITANFEQKNPNQSEVEINVRPYAFFPEKSGLGYITFQGFTLMNVACHWAPPTVYQPAAIGPNGGHHWIIEENIILYAKAAAISIGIPTNRNEADSVASGYHIIRNNVIMRSGQGATTGQWWNKHSQIYGNHIAEINYREEFGGWETAAIKHHGGDGMIIRDNFIRKVYTKDKSRGAAHGIWNDYRNTNWRVSNNIVMDTEGHSMLVEANWKGPALYENNIFVNGSVGIYSSRGDVWAHNLFVNAKQEWTNQTYGGRPPIGQSRWMNNIFVTEGLFQDLETDSTIYVSNVFLDEALNHPNAKDSKIDSTPSQMVIRDTYEAIKLSFTISENIVKTPCPLLDSAIFQLPFGFDADVATDFNGNDRLAETNKVGPFSHLQAGHNEFTIYEYPPLYFKAISIIDQE